MAKPTPEQIIKDAHKLELRFQKRNLELKLRSEIRYGEYEIKIPLAYKKTSEVFKSPIIREEGRQLLALIKANPLVHIPPPAPEHQDATTTMEKFAAASFQELECYQGSVDAQVSAAQVHERIGWSYFGMKRDFYGGAPTDTADIFDYAQELDDYKREAGINALFDYRFVPSSSVFFTGDHWNPNRVFEIKTIDEYDLIAEYDIQVNSQGEWSLPKDVNTLPSGTPEREIADGASRDIKFIEYWDRNWCFLICVHPNNMKGTNEPFLLDSWEHNWGRTPYFCRPAFETDQIDDEDKKFESPLDGLYAEVKTYNRLRTILSSVAYQTGFAPLKVLTKEGNDLIMDANGNSRDTLEFEPGKPVQLNPGQDIMPLIVSPEAAIIQNELAASEARIVQYSLSQIAKGVSPGSDTANSALTTLRRQQKSSLKTLNDNQARQYREMTKFMFERIIGKKGEGIGETVYVFDDQTSDQIALAPDDIVTLNVQVKSDADQGQDALIEEKQALEAYLAGAITELEYHMRRGKENPEEYVRATALDRLRRSFEPELFQGIKQIFGQSSALAALVAQNKENGQAADAIPGLLNTAAGIQDPAAAGGGGLGMGSGGMPRAEAVRSPALQETTQPL